MSEQQVRQLITKMFLMTYLPKIKSEVARFMEVSDERLALGREISTIVGRPVGVFVGELKVAEPTNDLIDSLVKIYVQKENEETKK